MIDYIELGDVASVTKLAGFEFTKYFRYNTTGEIIALRAKNIRNGKLDLSDIHHIDADVSEQLPRSQLHKGDIIFTYTGNGYGDSTIIPESGKFHLAPNICKITPEKVEPYFLFKYMRSNEFLQQVDNCMVGSSQPTIPMNIVRKLTVPNISRDTQRTIAEVLSSLDDKIDLLTLQNVTLERLAQTYFRQWFVEEVQKDWEIVKISDFADITTGKGLKREFFDEDGQYPVLGANGEIGRTNSYLYNEQLIITGRVGTHGKVFLINDKVWISDNVLIIKPKQPQYIYGLYFCLKNLDFDSLNVGSTQPLITQTDIKNQELLYSNGLFEKFANIVDNLFEKIERNNAQILTLQKLRDTLLPKLISGEVRVK